MEPQSHINNNLNHVVAEINYDISLLYVIPCAYTRNLILNHLRSRMALLECIIKTIKPPTHLQPQPLPPKPEIPPILEPIKPENQKTFTLQELAAYDGKDGNPAYVAVNGIVCNVTNSAAWAAATHFGLIAGRDLTDEFIACHVGQPILNTLTVVGKLV